MLLVYVDTYHYLYFVCVVVIVDMLISSWEIELSSVSRVGKGEKSKETSAIIQRGNLILRP